MSYWNVDKIDWKCKEIIGVKCQHKSEREVLVHTNQPLNNIGAK